GAEGDRVVGADVDQGGVADRAARGHQLGRAAGDVRVVVGLAEAAAVAEGQRPAGHRRGGRGAGGPVVALAVRRGGHGDRPRGDRAVGRGAKGDRVVGGDVDQGGGGGPAARCRHLC